MSAAIDLGAYRRTRERETYDVEAILRRLGALKAKRYTWDSHWQEVARRIWPDGDEFQGRAASTRSFGGGDKRTEQIFDATGAQALERFSAFMESLNTPAHKIWHDLRASDEQLNKDLAVKLWFEQINKILQKERQRPKANFKTQMQEGYKSLGAFGGLPIYLDEAPAGGFRYRYCHVNQLYIEVDHTGSVDTIYRCYSMSARAATQRWGERAGEKVRTAMVTDKPDDTFEFVHVVKPRKDVDPDLFGPESMPWVSIYVACEDKQIAEEGGFEEMPYFYARWTVNPSEIYGRSPAMMALPHVKTAHEMMRTFISSGHRVVDPPLLLAHDGVMGAGSTKVRNVPGGLNYSGLNMQGQQLIQPLQTGMQLDLTETMLETERKAIREWFLVDLFRAALEELPPGVTATAYLQRATERGDIIAPQSGRLQSELYGPLIAREVGILQRQGRLPPPPPALVEAQGEYTIEYVSEAARLQRSREALGIRSTLEFATAASAIDPTARFAMKMTDAVRIIADYEGTPSEIVRTEDEIAELVAAEAQAQQQAQQLAAFQQGAVGAKDAASALASVAQAGQTRSATGA